MYLDQSQLQRPEINISGKLIASIKVLEYSAQQLDQAVTQEVSENPALEMEEILQCTHCGTPLRAGVCPYCDGAEAKAEDSNSDMATWEDFSELRGLAQGQPEDDGYDPLNFVQSGGTLHEYLMRQLGASLPHEDQPIAEYLIGSLDSHGFITTSVEEAAEALRLPPERVAAALEALQALDPPGIGARDASECLLIQLRPFEEAGTAPPLARTLLLHHLKSLGAHRFAEIARELGTTLGEVKCAWQFIKVNLNPYPAHAFGSGDVPGLALTGGERSAIIRPDVVIRRTENGFESEVLEKRRYRFSTNPIYRALYDRARAQRAAPDELGEEGRQHIRTYVTRARFFISCMQQRWDTLTKISEALIHFQRDFLEHGVRHLRPLTRGELAQYVGLHESTVSRATANKYVMLPEGRTVAFDEFFDGSLAPKDILRELIAGEDAEQPLSDEDLALLLKEQGVDLARRTVAKYREALRILPSRLRV